MNRAVARLGAVAALAALWAGCASLDPSVYQGYSTTPSAAQGAGAVASSSRSPAGSRAGSAGREPFGATPRREELLWGVPGDAELLARSPDNVAIVVEKLDAKSASAMGLGGRFRARSGDAVIAGGGRVPRGGLSVRVLGRSFAGRFGAAAGRTRASSRQQMFIVVRSGTEGVLSMGRDIWMRRLGYRTPRGYVVIAEREFVGRQLAVRPTILPGGWIAIELWPRFSTRRGRVVDVTQLATRVKVRDGQSLVIGGLNTAGSELNAALFGASGREASSTSAIVLTAKIGGLDFLSPKGR